MPTPPPGGKKKPAAAPAKAQNSFQRTDLRASAAAPPSNAPPPPDAPANNSAADPNELSQRASDGFLVNGTANNGAASTFSQNAAFGNNRRGPGSLYQFQVGLILDNSALDARPFSLTGQDTPKPAYNHLSGLANFAGPIRIGHFFKAPPTVFLNYQWTRNRNDTVASALMPLAVQRTGDFSASPGTIIDPSAGAPFAGNIIPASRISPQAQALLNFYPLPNFLRRYRLQLPDTHR